MADDKPTPREKNDVQEYLPGMEMAPEDYILKKHNAIIHRTHASTPTEEKVFSALLMVARAQMKSGIVPPDGKFQTSIKFLRNFTRTRATHNHLLKNALTSLQERPWQYDMFHEDKFQEWRSFVPISEARINRFGCVTFFFAPTINEALNNPSIYTQIDLKIIRGLKSLYSIALYELGVTHIDEHREFSLEEFRDYMGLKVGEYSAPTDLRRHVVESAVNEVNEKTDVRVEVRLLKRGNRGALTGFDFTFSRIEEVEVVPEAYQLEQIAELCAMLPDGIGSLRGVVPLLKKMLDQRGEENVISNIQYFVERFNDKTQASIPSPGGYLRTVLENDYGLEIRERKEIERLLQEKKLLKESLKDDINNAYIARNAAEDSKILQMQDKYYEYYLGLPASRQAEIIERIEHSEMYIGPMKTQIMGYLQLEEKVFL
jgi:hypothetical protein